MTKLNSILETARAIIATHPLAAVAISASVGFLLNALLF